MYKQNLLAFYEKSQNHDKYLVPKNDGNSCQNATENNSHFGRFTDVEDLEMHIRSQSWLTVTQTSALEKAFAKKQYIDRIRRAQLAIDLNLTSSQVRIWFRNRRLKAKRHAQQAVTKNQSISPAPKQISPTPKQISSAPKLIIDLPHLMTEMTATTVQTNVHYESCPDWKNSCSGCFSNNTNLNYNQTPFSEVYVGPITPHCETNYDIYRATPFGIHEVNNSPYVPSSDLISDYEGNFLTDYY